MAGSLGLNQRFAAAVQALVGETQWQSLQHSKAFNIAERQFDKEIKRSFCGGDDVEYFVTFPMANLADDPDLRLQANTWTMTGYERQ